MSTWDDRFDGHRVWAALAAAREALAQSLETAEKDPEALEAHLRLSRVAEFVEHEIRQSDRMLTSPQTLEAIAAYADQVTSHVQQYVPNNNAAYLANAQQPADQMLAHIGQLVGRPETRGDIEDMQGAASSYRKSIAQLARNAADDLQGLREAIGARANELAAQGEKITLQEQRLDAIVAQAQQEILQVQSKGQADFAQVVSEARASLQQTLTEAQQQSRSAADELERRSSEAVAKVETTTTEAVERVETESERRLEEATSSAAAKLTELDALLRKAEETVQAIGSTGMSGGYQIMRKEEAKQADRMRLLAVVALLGAIVAAIVFAGLSAKKHLAWDATLTKSFVSVPLLLLAGYAARESNRHRDQARIARQVELQLASIDSYLVDLDPGERRKVKERLADRFFGDPRLARPEDIGQPLSLPTSLP